MSAAALSTPAPARDLRQRVQGLSVVALVLALLGSAAWWLPTAQWPIEQVRIDGAVVHADRGQIKSLISDHARAGFFGMDLEGLRADLRGLPWVRDASLRRVWPDTLDATIREYHVAARWNGDALLSQRGVVFRPDPVAGADAAPRLTGPEGHGPAMLERLGHFNERLAPLGLAVASLHQDARRGWRLELANGVTLRLGQTEQVDARFERFAALWPRALAGEAERIAAVDMRYPNGFAVDWRGEGIPAGTLEGGGA